MVKLFVAFILVVPIILLAWSLKEFTIAGFATFNNVFATAGFAIFNKEFFFFFLKL